MKEELKKYLDSLEGMFGQAEVIAASKDLLGDGIGIYELAALEILNRRIQLTEDQKSLIQATEASLSRNQSEKEKTSEEILGIIDSAATFLGLIENHDLNRMIALGKIKQKYLYSSSKRTQFEIPAITDIANIDILDFTDEDKKNWHYWNKHRTFLEDKLVKPGNEKSGLDIIARLDRQSDKILRNIRDPRNPFPNDPSKYHFRTNGLVIGHVQSGKTANFMALISKSASIGYRFIIILSGTKNDLRNQTQNRFDQELSGFDRYGLKKRGVKFADWTSPSASNEIIEWSIHGVDTPQVANAGSFWRYHPLTTTVDFDDNGSLPNFTDVFTNQNVVVAIVKKNAIKPLPDSGDYEYRGILGKLNKWILDRRDKSFLPPTLIIDDEADQAGVDSNASEEAYEDEGYSPTTINGCLQTLVGDIYGERLGAEANRRQICFIGYTATPFSNVFISAIHDRLYPKDFIIALAPPENYFGMDKYFGSETRDLFIDNCQEEQAHEERELLKDPFLTSPPAPIEAILPERLISAFHYFLFYSAVKDFRCIQQEKTMMIHSSRINDEQAVIFKKVKAYKETLQNDLSALGIGSLYWQSLHQDWNEYSEKSGSIRNALHLNHDWPSWTNDEFTVVMNDILSKLTFKLVNGPNDSLDYTKEQLDYVVAVGGDILSRGLTLEGLGISYYMRNSNTYDSLLQMARWFGYRDGYEDLIRVVTSQSISDSFEHLLLVEADLREEIKTYEREGIKPEQFAPAVRAHMRMRPSGRMGVAQRQTSFSGQIIQTHIMRNELSSIKYNHTLAHIFVDELKSQYQYRNEGSKYLFEGVEPKIVVDYFLVNYKYGHTDTRGVKGEEVLEYIRKNIEDGNLNSIDVVLSGPTDQNAGNGCEKENFASGQIVVNPVRRGNIRKKTKDFIFFGAVSDPRDFTEKRDRAVLALYFIDHINSKHGDPETQVFDTSVDINPVGFALGFPHYGDAEFWRQTIFKI